MAHCSIDQFKCFLWKILAATLRQLNDAFVIYFFVTEYILIIIIIILLIIIIIIIESDFISSRWLLLVNIRYYFMNGFFRSCQQHSFTITRNMVFEHQDCCFCFGFFYHYLEPHNFEQKYALHKEKEFPIPITSTSVIWYTIHWCCLCFYLIVLLISHQE